MIFYWDGLCELFDILAYLVKKSADDGIDMYFTMTDKQYHGKDVSGLVKTLKERKNALRGVSNIHGRLEHILGHYCRTLKNEVDLRRQHSPFASSIDTKPLSVYVFTNALWSKKSDPKAAIENVVNTLIALNYPSSQVGIQFISFGDHADTLKSLEYYESGLGLSM